MPEMQWFNPPAQWQASPQGLEVQVDARTDFWRVTRHDFIKDDAHFYYRSVSGDFRAEVTVHGAYQALYDQAGLMLRQDERTWLKCGIEFLEGVQQASAVLTREFSDWSIVPLPDNPAAIRIQVLRIGSAVEVSFARPGQNFVLIRQGYLTPAPTLQIGMMCAAPQGEGFAVRFTDFALSAL